MQNAYTYFLTWVVVKILVPFWVPIIVRHLIFRVPNKRDPNFDSHPHANQGPKPHCLLVRSLGPLKYVRLGGGGGLGFRV